MISNGEIYTQALFLCSRWIYIPIFLRVTIVRIFTRIFTIFKSLSPNLVNAVCQSSIVWMQECTRKNCKDSARGIYELGYILNYSDFMRISCLTRSLPNFVPMPIFCFYECLRISKINRNKFGVGKNHFFIFFLPHNINVQRSFNFNMIHRSRRRRLFWVSWVEGRIFFS